MPKKALIFTYYWPPSSGPGVQRFLKFCKFLPEFDWEPIVVTPANGSYPYTDDSLLKDVSEYVKVYKTKTLEPFAIFNMLQGKKGKSVPVAFMGLQDSPSLFQKIYKYIRANYFIPDARVGWNKYAIKEGSKIIQKEKIDVIITTSPPHSTHLVGKELKKKYNIPWIADFRDPWTTVHSYKYLPRTEKTKQKDKFMEDDILCSADKVVVATPGLKEEFSNRAKNIEAIYNGYDEADVYQGSNISTKHFTLSYIGNFKPNQDVPELWIAIAELIREKEEFAEHFRLAFTGVVDKQTETSLRESDIKNNLIINDFVSHKEATKLMFDASLLLLPIPKSDGNRLILTGKIFEYLAADTPILSIGPLDGDAAAVLSQSKRDSMFDYGDTAGYKELILRYFKHWLDDDKINFKHEGNEHCIYSRKALTEKLSDALNKICNV